MHNIGIQRRKHYTTQDGFSLAEISVVLVIIAMVVGMSLSAGQTYMVSMRTTSIQHQLESIREALHLFRAKYGRYPCPASEDYLISSASYGTEISGCESTTVDAAISGITHTSDARIVRGMLPFKSLGITQSSAIDPWGNRITYAVDLAHAVNSTVGLGTLQIVDGYNNSVTASPVQGQAIFALISHGEDGNGAYPANSATRIACGTGTKALENCDDDDVYMDALPTNSTVVNEQYDDYVLWYSQERTEDIQQPTITTIDTARADTTCAIKSDKTLWCWGINTYGQVGNNSTTTMTIPTQVSGGGAWKSIAMGDVHNCAIKSDDTLWCWGRNTYGQVGDNTTASKRAPTQINGGGSWKSVSISDVHSCAIKSDDTLWCWGRNNYGQVGDNTTTNKTVPTEVNGGGTWDSVSATGDEHSCAIKSDDTLWCWGNNTSGYLGDNTLVAKSIPTAVSGGGSWKTVGISDNHGCAIKSDDTLWCWGENGDGQVGDNTLVDKKVPTTVNGGGTWKILSSHHNTYTCAIKSDDTLWCWGDNAYGQIGDGTTTKRRIPTTVSGGGTWTAINRNCYSICGLKSDGTLWCWGRNHYGQVGDGTKTNVKSPTRVKGGGQWQAASLNYYTSCAIKSDGTLWCWGKNGYGQVGNGTVADYTLPIPAAFAR